MSKAGDTFVRCCNRLHQLPSLILCSLLILLQACVIDYYLIHHLAIEHLFWAAGDLIVLILIIICFRLTTADDNDPKKKRQHPKTHTFVWVTWFTMQVLLSVKVIIICTTFSTELDEEKSFFGPNTLKTAIALGSCTFVLLLSSQHDVPPSSDRKRYIEELTGTVVFDVMDTADILDVLFDADDRPGLSSGIPEIVLSVAVLNLLLPTVPLLTLSHTKFGEKKLKKKYVYMHRLLLVLAVNVPNLLVRMILWHGFSVGVSPFTLKNIVLICMTLYEFYEHKKEKFEMHEREAIEMAETAKHTGSTLSRDTRSGNGHDDSGDNDDVQRLRRSPSSQPGTNNNGIDI